MYYRYTIVSLTELLAVVRESERGFRACAQNARHHALRLKFLAQASKRARRASALAELIRQLGGDPGRMGERPGTGSRGWVELRTVLALNDDAALVDACERGEDHALEVYRNALDDHLPELVRQVVLRQFEDMMSDHHEIRVLRTDARRSGIVSVSIGGDARQ